MAKLFESDDYILVNILLLFLLINFNLEIGTIYLFMAVIDWFAYYIALSMHPFQIIPLERNPKGRFMSLIWAMGIYVAFIFSINFLGSRFSTATVSEFDNVFEYVSSLIASTFSATPILYGSKYIRLAVWGILIAFIETRAFFRTFMQWAVHAAGAKMPSSPFSKEGLFVCGFFGALFAVFHIVAKGITNNLALTVTFVFGALSIGVVLYFKQYLEAAFLHIITNTIATMQQLGIGFFAAGTVGFNQEGFVVLGSVLLVVWLVLFQELPFLKGNGVRS